MHRKIISFLVMMVCLLMTLTASAAATVTDVNWGVNKENVLRLVVDLTEKAPYSVELDGPTLRMKVDGSLQGGVMRKFILKSDLAKELFVEQSGDQVVLRLPMNKTIGSSDYKSFYLRKDSATGRPDRVVLDVTANRMANAVIPGGSTSVKSGRDSRFVPKPVVPRPGGGTTISGGPVVSNKPVVGNRPASVTSGKSSSKGGTVVTNRPSVKGKPVIKGRTNPTEETRNNPVTGAVVASGAKALLPDYKYRTGGGIKGKNITIDPGHGGSDPGAIGLNGTKEKDSTIRIARFLKQYLEEQGAKVTMTRETDVDVSSPGATDSEELQARVDVSTKSHADMFISIHHNANNNRSVAGLATYYYPKTNNDYKLAKAVQDHMLDSVDIPDFGVRQANFYVVKRSFIPAILTEIGFISNPEEEKLLNSVWFQKKIAQGICDGIVEYFK